MLSVLILCTGNSARSILGEALFSRKGAGRLRAYSAGSQPKDKPHPMALTVLEAAGHSIDGYQSKSWSEFGDGRFGPVDIVITVCDSAAQEACPVWPGAPVSVHWGLSDPATLQDDAPHDGQREAFDQTYRELEKRIDAVLKLPLERMENSQLKASFTEIHENFVGIEATK